ncbi:hypothetical protein G8770_15920 [Aestuariicella hydrocarbonica]|uniref:Uncharacterized protein n=1 Tax=Pseudomaricurvus hydrocarbonicus TaxID=1470433 RepID=A0A9E5T3C3_9GAMM|nr:hypothetical protein [Aestuariicella hydrocarbonica]NHO67038.1 hypothetical protein [Aestuariicella hydrocarbonica]
MNRKILGSWVFFGLLSSSLALAADKAAMIASAESAAPVDVTANATIKAPDGTVLRQGSNGFTCYPQQAMTGPMCNEAEWEKLMAAMMSKQDYQPSRFSISYMLAGEGTAKGVSNIDPYATEPTADNAWIKEGPHMMVILPDHSMLEGISTNTQDPIYVMWKGTPYAHVMIKIASEKE